ncbi:Hypothetical protein NTJ_14473 [Nesidiocoris tenuis]|uniref:Uncharacterized protein n=1 Tax=Nesidiocoris tenuis TaxID=355587 RepID=A0ABN7BEV0_9HEMI|nr:Hypothetical protein NTJ_14473 [Nesidiocoris tenuis]
MICRNFSKVTHRLRTRRWPDLGRLPLFCGTYPPIKRVDTSPGDCRTACGRFNEACGIAALLRQWKTLLSPSALQPLPLYNGRAGPQDLMTPPGAIKPVRSCRAKSGFSLSNGWNNAAIFLDFSHFTHLTKLLA